MSATRSELARALEAEEEGLLTCVHCGFCLPACPTYVRLGDENDSPRGRLHLMRAVVEGRLDPADPAFQRHIDRCLGCRACEPVCPSGVPYGDLLELARAEASEATGRDLPTRLLLAVFASDRLGSWTLLLGRMLRATGIPALLARILPTRGRLGGIRLAFGMLAATRPVPLGRAGRPAPGPGEGHPAPAQRGAATAPSEAPDASSPVRTRVALLRGCVQEGLFGHVNEATERVLESNGAELVRAPGQGCCGALHAHAGDLDTARELARRNVDAFEASGADAVVVNAAGCGAAMKGYGHLLAGDPAYGERAARLAERVRDVSEALGEDGPAPGEPLRARVAYDPPCHLLHAQGVQDPPRRLLEAAGVELVPVEEAAECCGGAGIYGLTHPELGGRIGGDKVDRLAASGVHLVATGNPGCIMQIGAGLRGSGRRLPVVHPVELLDESYRRGGRYDGDA